MYVPGTTENLKNVVVEIGTGYYAEKVDFCLHFNIKFN